MGIDYNKIKTTQHKQTLSKSPTHKWALKRVYSNQWRTQDFRLSGADNGQR